MPATRVARKGARTAARQPSSKAGKENVEEVVDTGDSQPGDPFQPGFLAGVSAKDELLRRLSQLSKALQQLEQSPESAIKVRDVAQELVQARMLNHRDVTVKLHTACCLADTLRVCAPEAPFDSTTLERVLQLFIRQVSGLKNGAAAPNYAQCFFLLERLAVVKIMVMLCDLETTDLIETLLSALFDTVMPSHNNKVQTYLLEVIISVLDNMDTVTQSVLDQLMAPLIEPARSENPAAYQLATRAILRCTNRLQGAVSRFFNGVLLRGAASDSEYREHVFELMPVMYEASRSILLYVFPNMEELLRQPEAKERCKIVKVLGAMFADADATLEDSFPPVWAAFVERISDAAVDVRCSAIAQVQRVVSAKPSVLLRDAKLSHALVDRLQDPEERVRRDLVRLIREFALQHLPSMPNELALAVAERLRDRKASVACAAIDALATVHRMAATAESSALRDRFAWISGRILRAYHLGASPDVRLRIEQVLDRTLLPLDAPQTDRMAALVDLLTPQTGSAKSEQTQTAMAYLQQMIQMKLRFRAMLSKYLQDRKKDPENDNVLLMSVANAFPSSDRKAADQLARLHVKEPQRVLRDLRTLCDDASDYDALVKARRDALAAAKGDPILDIVKPMTQHASMTVLCIDSVPALLSVFGDYESAEGADCPAALATLDLLVFAASNAPTWFTAVLPDLCGLLLRLCKRSNHADATAPLTRVLQLLYTLAQRGSAAVLASSKDATRVRTALVSLAKTATHLPLVKYAVRVLAAVYAVATVTAVLSQLVADAADSFADSGALARARRDRNLPALCRALKLCAHVRVVVPAAAEAHDERLQRWICDHVLSDDQNTSDVDAVKVLGLKYLAACVQGTSPNREPAQFAAAAKVLLQRCVSILQRVDSQRDAVYLGAATALLKTSKVHAFERLIDAQTFPLLALAVQHPSFDVRAVMLRKLRIHNTGARLPLRFLAPLALAAVDPEAENVRTAKAALEELIDTRREIVRLHEDKMNDLRRSSLLPEYAVPYVVHLLAHHPDVALDISSSSPSYQIAQRCWLLFLDALLAHHDSVAFVLQMLDTIKRMDDAVRPGSDNIHHITDLATQMIKARWAKRAWTLQSHPGKIVVPSMLYAPAKSLHVKSFLPADLRLVVGVSRSQRSMILASDDVGASPLKSPRKRKSDDSAGSVSKRRRKTPSKTAGGKRSRAVAAADDDEDLPLRRSRRTAAQSRPSYAGAQQDSDESSDDGDAADHVAAADHDAELQAGGVADGNSSDDDAGDDDDDDDDDNDEPEPTLMARTTRSSRRA